MEIASNLARVKLMAHLDQDEYFLVWLAEPLLDDVLTAGNIHLMQTSTDQGADVTEPACGYIIRDWFGPFLFGPIGRGMRGNC
jgi:hypothetical protein